MKKFLLTALALVTVAVVSIVGTVAYLTWDDSDLNVMTTGNVSIEQNEQDRYGNDFVQGQPLLPYVTLGTTEKETVTVNGYEIQMRTKESVGNYMDKIVTVTNTGKTDAYVRTLIAIPAALENDDTSKNIIHWNVISDSDTNPNNGWMWDIDNGKEWGARVYATIEIDGVKYNVYVATNKNVIKAGEATAPSLVGIYLDSKVDFDGDRYTYDGQPIDYDFSNGVAILVMSQAIQANGFADAKTALDAGFGEVNAENAAEWFEGVIYEANTDTWDKTIDKTWFDAEAAANATAENPVTFTVDTAEEFAGFVNLANTNSFKNVIVKLDHDIDLGGANWNEGGTIAAYGPAFNGTLDGNGHTIYNLTAQNNWTYANALFRTIGNDVTIKNLTIEGANINNAAASGNNKEYGILVGIVGSGTLTIENVTIRNSMVSCKTSAGILVGGMTEGAIKCKNVVMENCAVSVSNASGKGGAILGDGWSAHDYDYAGIYTDNVKVINCTYMVAGVSQAELPLYNYVK